MMSFAGFVFMFVVALFMGDVALEESTVSQAYRDYTLLSTTLFISIVCCAMAYVIAATS